MAKPTKWQAELLRGISRESNLREAEQGRIGEGCKSTREKGKPMSTRVKGFAVPGRRCRMYGYAIICLITLPVLFCPPPTGSPSSSNPVREPQYSATFEQERYAAVYGDRDTRAENVVILDKPHDCDFFKAPIGDKECHYKKTVIKSGDGLIVGWDRIQE
jgi:hypothetical protein